jgi:organic hydroperoxide reductase OsmC/OhrA
LAFAERAGLTFRSYQSEAEGRVELVDGKLQVTSVLLKPTVTLTSAGDAEKANEILHKAEINCLISNSVKTRVSMQPTMASQ